MGCATGCAKCILYFLNIVLLFEGLSSVAFAVIYIKSLPTIYIVYMLVVAAFGVLIAILGCIGMCKENVPLTKAYAVLILVSFVVQLGGKFLLTDVEEGKKIAEKGVRDEWANELVKPGAMDHLQTLYSCCGLESAKDYTDIPREIPKSCYFLSVRTDPYKDGCIKGADDFITFQYKTAHTGIWFSLGFNVFLFAIACFLVIHFTNKQRRYNYNR